MRARTFDLLRTSQTLLGSPGRASTLTLPAGRCLTAVLRRDPVSTVRLRESLHEEGRRAVPRTSLSMDAPAGGNLSASWEHLRRAGSRVVDDAGVQQTEHVYV